MSSEQQQYEKALYRQAAAQIDGMATLGLPVDVDPDVADFMAAFDEDALAEAEARASALDVDENGVVITDEEDGQ